jgi:flagellar biosynthetic protein FliR
MPQMQVFFLAMPLTILIGMLVLLAALGAMMSIYLGQLGSFLAEFGRR